MHLTLWGHLVNSDKEPVVFVFRDFAIIIYYYNSATKMVTGQKIMKNTKSAKLNELDLRLLIDNFVWKKKG